MAKEIYIPNLGQTMEQATIARWLVVNGTQVEEGQEILEVETDKSTFAVEATARGHLHIGPFKPGDVVPVLTVIATIGKADEKFSAKVAEPEKSVPENSPIAIIEQLPIAAIANEDQLFASPRARKLASAKNIDLKFVVPTGDSGRRIIECDVMAFLAQQPKATPVAQKMAEETGVDLCTVGGTGLGGKITKADVARTQKPVAASAPLPQAEIIERAPLKGVRGIIAERMATSVHTTARVTLLMEVDATELVTMRERLKARVAEEWGFAPGYNDLIAKIVALALRRFPYINARLANESIEQLAYINLGMATDTERGLLVPVIRNADTKSVREFSAEFRSLIDRARKGKSLPDDLTGGTFTITNLGMFDIMAFTPVINLPEAAILGVGCITSKPVVRDNQIVTRQILMLSLVFDHRIVDGAPAARFLQYIKQLIEEPYLLAVV